MTDYGALDHAAYDAALAAVIAFYHGALREKDAEIERLQQRLALPSNDTSKWSS